LRPRASRRSASRRAVEIGAPASQFIGQVEIEYRDVLISAERAIYDRENQSIEALGRVTLTDAEGVTVFGEDARVDAEAETITFSGAGFDIPARPARGSAERILIQSDSTMSLADVLFTTCPVDNTSWELHAKSIDFDANRGTGRARGMKLDFKGVPILYAPYPAS
jgi:LPS-assembly protein